MELSAFVNSLIIDEGAIYDPRQVNDRLLLGLKRTLSELEFSTSARGAVRLKVTQRRAAHRGGEWLPMQS
jgi:hypothetical protein